MSRATIGDRAAADRLRDCDNSAGIGDNSAEIGDGAAGIGRERDPMLNSILNGDWSNSVPGRKISEGFGAKPPTFINRGRDHHVDMAPTLNDTLVIREGVFS